MREEFNEKDIHECFISGVLSSKDRVSSTQNEN